MRYNLSPENLSQEIPQDSNWGVVSRLGLEIVPKKLNGPRTLVYGSADPLPNPAELILIQLTASKLGLGWRFFVYKHGRNLPMFVPENWNNLPGVFDLENIVPSDLSLRELAKEIFLLRREPVIVAHRPDGRTIRATSTKLADIPDITINVLHEQGGWLGGAAIHFILRLWAEKDPGVVYLCPFSSKGRVYEVYKGVGRQLFVLSPFVHIQPPPSMTSNVWEPITWNLWRTIPATARRHAWRLIRREIKRFFRWGEPRRIEIPWGWWLRGR